MPRRIDREAHLPTKRSTSVEETWFPSADEHPRRPQHHEVAPPEGSGQAVGLIYSVRGRRAFDDLRRSKTRASAGKLWITTNADATDRPRIAFAIPRSAGTAVQRNRARRQLRALLGELDQADSQYLPPGDYLIGVRSADFTSAEAHAWLSKALRRLQGL